MSTSLKHADSTGATEERLLEKLAAPSHQIKYTHHREKSSMGVITDAIQEELDRQNRKDMGVVGGIVLLGVLAFLFLPELTLEVFCILTLLLGMFLFVSASLGEGRIKGDAKGIELPLIFCGQIGTQLDRKWTHLRRVAFTLNGKPSKNPDKINLQFTDEKEVSLNIDGFTREGLETLTLLFGTYCDDDKISPPLKELNLGIEAGKEQSMSFTRLWEADMERRFGSTAFVPLESGDTLHNERIRIVGQMAFGGLSAVYLARMEGKDLVAVKEVVLPESASQETRDKALELFKREAGLLSRINHVQVAQVYDYVVENGRHYLLMEFRDGMDLRKYVGQQGPQSEDIAIRWARETGEIVRYLHSLDPPVIHRDLTPENIVLEKNGRIAVIDFGAANAFLGTATGTLIGKPSYIPPEQFKGKATLKSDVFALGCTLFFILTGKDPEPFVTSSPAAAGARVSNRLERLINDATSPDMGSRVASIDEFLGRLKDCGS